MPRYRLTFKSGAVDDGINNVQTKEFSTSNDKLAQKQAEEHLKEITSFGGFIADKILERGHRITIKVKRFRAMKKISLPT